MQLAHQKMLPEVLAAVVRAMSAARSLVAFEHGAIGPSKDCAYEGPMIMAITGCPIAMEGKSATCAHFSPLARVSYLGVWQVKAYPRTRLYPPTNQAEKDRIRDRSRETGKPEGYAEQ